MPRDLLLSLAVDNEPGEGGCRREGAAAVKGDGDGPHRRTREHAGQYTAVGVAIGAGSSGLTIVRGREKVLDRCSDRWLGDPSGYLCRRGSFCSRRGEWSGRPPPSHVTDCGPAPSQPASDPRCPPGPVVSTWSTAAIARRVWSGSFITSRDPHPAAGVGVCFRRSKPVSREWRVWIRTNVGCRRRFHSDPRTRTRNPA
jgi:hypothetical protein